MTTEPVQMELFTNAELAEVRPMWLDVRVINGIQVAVPMTQEDMLVAEEAGMNQNIVGPFPCTRAEAGQYVTLLTTFFDARHEWLRLWHNLKSKEASRA